MDPFSFFVMAIINILTFLIVGVAWAFSALCKAVMFVCSCVGTVCMYIQKFFECLSTVFPTFGYFPIISTILSYVLIIITVLVLYALIATVFYCFSRGCERTYERICSKPSEPIVTEVKTSCTVCGFSGYGPTCIRSSYKDKNGRGLHHHEPNSHHCIWCGRSVNAGHCAWSPSGYHSKA